MAAKETSRQIDINKLSFEEASQKLQEIVADIEQGKIGLEESIKQYELGCKLIQHSRKILDQAERKVQMLSKTSAGKLEATDAGLPEQEDQDQATDAQGQ